VAAVSRSLMVREASRRNRIGSWVIFGVVEWCGGGGADVSWGVKYVVVELRVETVYFIVVVKCGL
jgi:hypothetical protein